MTEAIGWLGIWSTLLLCSGMLRGDLHCRQPLKFMLLPGLMLEAAIRGTGYLLSGTPLTGFDPFADGQPVLPEAKSRWRWVGLPLGLTIRFLLLLSLVYWTLGARPEFFEAEFMLPFIDFQELGWDPTSGREFLVSLAALPVTLELASIGSMLLFYCALSYTMVAGLTIREYGAALATIGSLLLLTLGAGWLGVTFSLFSRGWWIRWIYVPEVWSAFSLIVVLTALGSIQIIVLRLLGWAWASAREREPATSQ